MWEILLPTDVFHQNPTMGFETEAQHIDQVRDSHHFENELEEFKSDNYSDGLKQKRSSKMRLTGPTSGSTVGSVVASITAW